ncbi:MAG: hypothetical protein J1F42_02215 [Lachnospiraceae bacterium]|nr:hypothetical protein [Lachnospiraceae bacterium]
MAVKEYPAGTILAQSEQAITALHVIAKGTVRATYPGGEYYLTKGDVIGVCELFYNSYFITYQAEDNVSIASYAYSASQLSTILRSSAEMAGCIVTSMFKQFQEILDQYELARFDCDTFYHYLMSSYEEYVNFCAKHKFPARALPGLETLTELVLEEDVAGWTGGYYTQLRALVTGKPIKDQDADFLRGLLLKTSEDVYQVMSVCRVLYDYKSEITNLLMSENRLDFFDLYASLLYKVGAHADESTSLIAAISTMMIQLESQPSIDKTMYKERVAEYRERLNALQQYAEEQSSDDKPKDVPEIRDSMNTILSYAKVDEETAGAFRKAVNDFKKLTDKNNTDDASRKLRLTITKLFYQIYEKACLRSLHDFSVPKVVQMFFNFGYVDEQLAGMDNASYLYSIVDSLPSDPERGIYTFYEWLRAIYEGRKTPSRNEFDTDYQAYIHELKISGKISPEEETTMLKDREKQVLFELHNMFQSVNKITFGRISIFCPIFSEHNILKDLDKSLVSADKAEQALKQIRAVDFSAYYRDMIYTNPNLGIGKEYIGVEILPDIILMPNIGVRGVMWQEIEGRKRTTPSRMMISLFQMEDLTNILVRLTGDFRWEMCKRIQGARWNDVSEPSLTSRYFDYIQFYKKNHELSADAKDKIKLNMQKAKNSFKEMFIRDYESWILYEGSGSPRLNKIARSILFDYCPFSKEIRDKLKANPLYKETMERYDVKLSQRIHHYDNLFQKLKNMGASIPPEIQSQRDYLGY